jgi:hypothetical protein
MLHIPPKILVGQDEYIGETLYKDAKVLKGYDANVGQVP